MRCILVTILILLVSHCFAQNTTYTSLTTANGLPSNHIYQCVEDNKGFLWLATDAGVARFDGKNFQTFTTEHGLPDIDVIQIVKEKNGSIWVNCLGQSPAYFNEIKNRFINAKEDSSLYIKQGAAGSNLVALHDSGVLYTNELGYFILSNKKIKSHYAPSISSFAFVKNINNNTTVWFRNYFFENRAVFMLSKNNDFTDSIEIKSIQNSSTDYKIFEDNFYLFNKALGKCYKYSHFAVNPLRCSVDSFQISEPIITNGYSKNLLYMLSSHNKIYEFNMGTLQLSSITQGNYMPNSIYNDSKGNKWVGTVNKGLLLYRKKSITQIQQLDDFVQNNFLSLAHNKGKILIGNYNGQVVEFNQKNYVVHQVIEKSPNRIKKIIIHKKNVYTISEGGVYLNYTKFIYNPITKATTAGKTGMIFNDSIILLGTTVGIMPINTNKQLITPYKRFKRITVLEKSLDGFAYCGTSEGLYKYNVQTQQYQSLASLHPLLSQRIVGIVATTDSLVWVATSGNGIVVMKNEKIISVVQTTQGIISNFSSCLTAGKKQQVWLGTHKGISIINYNATNNQFQYKIQNITEKDGITNNVINDLLFYNDTVYAATDKGVSVISANISIPNYNIPVFVTQIKINQRDTIITHEYELTKNQQNIFLQFAAIELNGHFKNLLYSLDDSKTWITLSENVLTLNLNHGEHMLKVKAVDVNGNISNRVLTLRFNIATPFWKSIWFWIIVAVLFQAMAFFAVSRRHKKRKEIKLAQELASIQTASLEQQAFSSLMNPHFMFNALNSIQLFINKNDRQNANRYLTDFASLIRNNFESSQQSFVSLEEELENIKIYLRLEQMRFTNPFQYKIIINDEVDVDACMIPTMLLQPLLENALLHGLMHSNITGQIIIEITEENKNIKIIIIDNGIGAKNNALLKQNSLHKSHGMNLIKKRMKAFGQIIQKPIVFKSSEAFMNSANPGHKIELQFPCDLYNVWIQHQTKA